jgi:hypothetical protein
MATKTGKTTKKASRSGNPAARAAAAEVLNPPIGYAPQPISTTEITSPEAWVSVEGRGDDEIIKLPSGNVARVRRAGAEAFLAQGLIPDTLTPIVEKAIKSKKGMRPEQSKKIMEDPKQLGSLMEMLDRTTCYAVLEPRVVMPPTCVVCDELDTNAAEQHVKQSREDYHAFQQKPREAGVLYADRVDLQDKMFILQFTMGGTRDLERFRREHGTGMAGLLAGATDEGQAE